MRKPWVEQVTAINARFVKEMRYAKSFHYLHTYRQEMVSQARDHRALALREIGIRDDRRTGLAGI